MLRQLVRFGIVGAGNTALSLATYTLLLAVGTPYVAAGAIAFSGGAVTGYVLNRRWTFAARDAWRARIAYVAVQAMGLFLNSSVLWLAVHEAGLGRIAGYLAVVPPVTVAMFLANRAWVFRLPRAAGVQQERRGHAAVVPPA